MVTFMVRKRARRTKYSSDETPVPPDSLQVLRTSRYFIYYTEPGSDDIWLEQIKPIPHCLLPLKSGDYHGI